MYNPRTFRRSELLALSGATSPLLLVIAAYSQSERESLSVYGGATLLGGKTTLRARENPDDFTRPVVIMLSRAGHQLDAMSGRSGST